MSASDGRRGRCQSSHPATTMAATKKRNAASGMGSNERNPMRMNGKALAQSATVARAATVAFDDDPMPAICGDAGKFSIQRV